jgi:gluconolactonase
LQIQVLLSGLQYPESPCWSPRDSCLYYVEWSGDRLCALREGRISLVYSAAPGAGPCALAQEQDGSLWVCLYSSLQVIHITPQGELLECIDRYQDQAFKGPNDIVLDGRGGFYFTDSGDYGDDWTSGKPAGAVYYRAPNGELVRVASGLCFPNGIALDAERRNLFVNEHRQNRTWRYSIQPDGGLDPGMVFANLDDECLLDKEFCYELGPDGMEFDQQGLLWIAHYGGGKLIALNEDAERGPVIRLPHGRKPTNLDFRYPGGTMFVSEAELGLLYQVDLSI